MSGAERSHDDPSPAGGVLRAKRAGGAVWNSTRSVRGGGGSGSAREARGAVRSILFLSRERSERKFFERVKTRGKFFFLNPFWLGLQMLLSISPCYTRDKECS